MGFLDVPAKGLIGALVENLSDVLKPTLKAIPNWGELEKSPYGKKLSRNFVENVDNFIGSLHGLLWPPTLQTLSNTPRITFSV